MSCLLTWNSIEFRPSCHACLHLHYYCTYMYEITKYTQIAGFSMDLLLSLLFFPLFLRVFYSTYEYILYSVVYVLVFACTYRYWIIECCRKRKGTCTHRNTELQRILIYPVYTTTYTHYAILFPQKCKISISKWTFM